MARAWPWPHPTAPPLFGRRRWPPLCSPRAPLLLLHFPERPPSHASPSPSLGAVGRVTTRRPNREPPRVPRRTAPHRPLCLSPPRKLRRPACPAATPSTRRPSLPSAQPPRATTPTRRPDPVLIHGRATPSVLIHDRGNRRPTPPCRYTDVSSSVVSRRPATRASTPRREPVRTPTVEGYKRVPPAADKHHTTTPSL